jgi:hypothetical protein
VEIETTVWKTTIAETWRAKKVLPVFAMVDRQLNPNRPLLVK